MPTGWKVPRLGRTLVAKYAIGRWPVHMMDRIAKEAKKYAQKSEGTSKKTPSGGSGRETKGGGSMADRAKRAAKEFLK